MKKLLLSVLLSASVLLPISKPAFAQVDYWSHPHLPNQASGTWVLEYTKTIRPVTDYVNGRQSPTTSSRVISYFVSYETVVVRKTYWDGRYSWYLVESVVDGQQGWVRGDLFLN